MRYRLLRLKHRLGFHNWSEWVEFSLQDQGIFFYRYCHSCGKTEWGKC